MPLPTLPRPPSQVTPERVYQLYQEAEDRISLVLDDCLAQMGVVLTITESKILANMIVNSLAREKPPLILCTLDEIRRVP